VRSLEPAQLRLQLSYPGGALHGNAGRLNVLRQSLLDSRQLRVDGRRTPRGPHVRRQVRRQGYRCIGVTVAPRSCIRLLRISIRRRRFLVVGQLGVVHGVLYGLSGIFAGGDAVCPDDDTQVAQSEPKVVPASVPPVRVVVPSVGLVAVSSCSSSAISTGTIVSRPLLVWRLQDGSAAGWAGLLPLQPAA
jgi:hypothetical protein